MYLFEKFFSANSKLSEETQTPRAEGEAKINRQKLGGREKKLRVSGAFTFSSSRPSRSAGACSKRKRASFQRRRSLRSRQDNYGSEYQRGAKITDRSLAGPRCTKREEGEREREKEEREGGTFAFDGQLCYYRHFGIPSLSFSSRRPFPGTSNRAILGCEKGRERDREGERGGEECGDTRQKRVRRACHVTDWKSRVDFLFFRVFGVFFFSSFCCFLRA